MKNRLLPKNMCFYKRDKIYIYYKKGKSFNLGNDLFNALCLYHKLKDMPHTSAQKFYKEINTIMCLMCGSCFFKKRKTQKACTKQCSNELKRRLALKNHHLKVINNINFYADNYKANKTKIKKYIATYYINNKKRLVEKAKTRNSQKYKNDEYKNALLSKNRNRYYKNKKEIFTSELLINQNKIFEKLTSED